MERHIGTVAHVAKNNKGYWFVLCRRQRIYCHISNYSEIELPKVGDKLSFEIGPGHKPGFTQAINIHPATKEELNAGADALKAGL